MKKRAQVVPFLLAVAWMCCATSVSPAQCGVAWQSRPGLAGVSGPVDAMLRWDPDGAGPAPERLVVGGELRSAGHVTANHVATYDPVAEVWAGLGTGFDARVRALAVLANGDLVAAGDFTFAASVTCNHVARWDGTAWQPLGAGTNGVVRALAVLPNGDLVAAGDFASAGGVPAQRVARWDGTAWSSLGSGLAGPVHALATWNGTVVAGGNALSSTPAMQRIAFWGGSSWQPIGAGVSGTVYSLLALPGGELVAGGEFLIANASSPSSTDSVARWNGTAWTPPPGDVFGRVRGLAARPGGELAVAAGSSVLSVGTATVGTLASGNGQFHAVASLANGDLVAGGVLGTVNGAVVSHVTRSTATGWAAMPAVDLAAVRLEAATRLPGGDLVVGGWSTLGVCANVARWDGSAWHPLGVGPELQLHALATMPGGDVVAGGLYTGSGTPHRVARWNGATWTPMGAPTGFAVNDLAVLPDGQLLAVGYGAARWDGASWHPYPSSTLLEIHCVAVRPNGRFVVSGLTFSGSNVLEWDGAGWAALGTGTTGGFGVAALAVLPDGDVVAAGELTGAGGVAATNVARWDGQGWHGMGTTLTGRVEACAALPDGDVVACWWPTPFFNAPVTRRLMRWDGQGWSPLLAGGQPAELDGLVYRMGGAASGALYAVGSFQEASGQTANRLALLGPGCPPAVASYGSGCSGAAGPVQLAAASLPWLASTFRARATGLPNGALAIGVFGFGQVAVPLASVHPLGVPGCTVLVADDILLAFAAASGSVATAVVIPLQPILVGTRFHHQVVPVELDPLGITAITSSNALTLTIGVW